MSVFKENCPYCGTKSVAFTILHETLWSKGIKNPSTRYQRHLWDVFSKCGKCARGIVATFETGNEKSPKPQLPGRSQLLEIAPSAPDTGAPNYTPQNVARFFEQAMDNLPSNWDAAGGMFRKALDTGLKSKFPKMKGTLYARIEEAAEKQDLTPELAKWAHEIRLGGNDAAHEEELFSEKEAKDLAVFTQLVFQYLFMLPGMLSEARSDPDEGEAAEDQK